MSITDRTPEVVNIQLVERIGFNFPLHSEYNLNSRKCTRF